MKKAFVFALGLLVVNFASAQEPASQISDEQAHEIVLNGTPDDVKKLLETGYDVNKIYHCNTLLITAIKSASRGKYTQKSPSMALEKVKILVTAGSDINKIACPNNSMSALSWAISLPSHTFNLEQEIYLKLDNISQTTGKCNFPEIVSKPCKDITLEDIKKIKKSIHDAFIVKNKYLVPHFMSIIKYLVDNGAQVNAYEENGMKIAPIHLAAMNSEEITLEPLKYLIEKNANVNVTDVMGNTPLFFAFGSGNMKAVKLLLNSGADTKMKNMEGLLYDQVTSELITTYFSNNMLTK